MYSVIVSSVDFTKLNGILYPSFRHVQKYLSDKNLPPLDLIVVSGFESITRNYNEGISRAKYKLKFFIHDDIDVMDLPDQLPLFVKVDNLIKRFPNTGLIGVAGTTGTPTGWWWDTPPETMVGHVYMKGNVNEYWKWNTSKPFFSDVNYVDGIFMATPSDEKFSEDIKGFHLYDVDYCNVIKAQGYDIKVINHMVMHDWIKKPIETDFTYYRQKWHL